MSTTIDQKVVEMRFDNKQFENNVSTSMSTLDKLKEKLNLSGAAKGFEDVSSAAGRVNMSGLGGAVEAVSAKFSALGVMGVTALANITNSAVNAGKKIVSALTIEPIKMGFQEYETQIGAVQTILANTESKGSTLQDVNRALDELNTYADKTIYNFTEMTRNIGTFTAAGVDLNTSVSAIQGIANLAAISGSTSQQASTAMYQLSQALASGSVKLQDWNSIVNAGMGGQVFQDALKRTSEALGTGAEAAIEAKGSFRESLSAGWMTTEVLTKTLNQFTMASEEGSEEWKQFKKELMADGFTEQQAEEILKMANTATDAATKVKTFTQLWDTLKESAQSGWTQTWETIVGDFEESKEFLTKISDTLGGMIGASADARNAVITGSFASGWKQLLGQGISDEEGYIESVKNVAKEHGVAIDQMIEDEGSFQAALKKGLSDGTITSDMLSESVTNLADKIRGMSIEEMKAAGYSGEHLIALEKLEKGLKDGSISMDEYAKKITELSGREKIIKAIENAFEGVMNIVKPVKEAFSEIFPPITSEQLTGIIDNIQSLTERFKTLTSEAAPKIKSVFKGVFSIFDMGRKVIVSVMEALTGLGNSSGIKSLGTFLLDTAATIGDFFTSLNENFDTSGLSSILSKASSYISKFVSGTVDGLKNLDDVMTKIGRGLKKVGEVISNVAKKIWNVLSKVFSWIKENISIGDVFAGLAGGGIFMTAKKLSGFVDKIKEIIEGLFGEKEEGSSIKDKFNELLGSVQETLQSFTAGIKIGSVVAIAVAIGILSASIKTISEIDAERVLKSVVAIGAMMTMLSVTLSSMTKTVNKFKGGGLITAGISLIFVAEAINILADAVVEMSQLSLSELAKGLIGVGTGLGALSVALKVIDSVKISLTTSAAMLALAKSCEMLGDAMQKFATLSWSEIARGLTAMGGALAEFTAVLTIMSKFTGAKSIFGSASILISVQSLEKLSEGLKSFAEMSWGEIGRGLTAMGGALVELGVVTGVLGYLANAAGLLGAATIWVTIQGMEELADALKKFGSMSWGEIGRGLTAMGGALLELGVITGVLGYLANAAGLLGAATIWIAIQGLEELAVAFEKFGTMSWGEIGRGLVAMGGALLELGVITGVLGYFTNVAGILGAATIWVAIQGLDELANALKKFGSMSWGEIGRGLVAMGGALAEVAAFSGIAGFTGLFGIFGSVSLNKTIEGLNTLADALQKFGFMSWGEIKRGLAAMAAAMSEVAFGSLLSTLSGLGASSIAKISEPLGALADSVKKWSGVKVPEGLAKQLDELADGIEKFTFAGIGADAVIKVAPAIGVLATGVKKWTDVNVPENLTEQLHSLADGIEKFTFAGIGASAIAKAAPGVRDMASSVKKWSDVKVPDNIGDQLTGIAEGIKEFSFAFVGGWSISSLVTPLADLADSVLKWKDVSVPDGLKESLATISDGVEAFNGTLTGGWSIDTIADPLGNLADSIVKWNGVSIPENLSDDLSSLATGIGAYTTTGFGAGALKEVTPAIGDLADSITKWKDVSIPESLGENLGPLAEGVKKFNFSGSSAKSLNQAAPGIGVLADSIAKWSGVTVPENIVANLGLLADGVKKFIFSGSSAETLSVAAPGIGVLADSVAKWSGVTVPENIGANLESLADGVKKFTFGGSGAKTLTEATPAIGDMADSIAKWSGVTVPENLGTNLATLADGVKKFTFGGSGADSLTKAAPGISSMADSVSKWSGITVPENLGTNLVALADGVKKFTFGGSGADSLSQAAPGVGSMADSVKKWSGVTVPENIGANLASLAEGVMTFSLAGAGATALVDSAPAIGILADSIKKWSGVTVPEGLESDIQSMANVLKTLKDIKFKDISDGLSSVTDAINDFASVSDINKAIESLGNLGEKSANELIKSFKNKKTDASTAAKTLIDTMIETIEKKYSTFKKCGEKIVTEIKDGIDDSESSLKKTVKSAITASVEAIESKYSDFYDAGEYLVEGFADGITENTFQAEAAASAMASAALEAAEEALDENSPSKEAYKVGNFFGVGFVNAIKDYQAMSYSAGYSMADSARVGLNNAVNKISSIIDSEMSMNPTIRPVLDLSDIRSGTATISSMLTMGSSIGVLSNVGSIGAMMDSRSLHGSNTDVVTAIKKLEKVIANIPGGNTYQIGDITYDDGSNISEAVKAIVREARMDRRR